MGGGASALYATTITFLAPAAVLRCVPQLAGRAQRKTVLPKHASARLSGISNLCVPLSAPLDRWQI